MTSQEYQYVLQILQVSPPPQNMPLPERRAAADRLAAQTPVLEGAEVVELQLPGPAGALPALQVTAAAASNSRVVLYLHGGGYVLGSPLTHRDLACRLSAVSGAQVLLLDYRLAPEHPFPAAVVDAVAAFRRLLSDGFVAGQIVIGGDSAGGGLALAAMLRLREAGEPLPAAACILSPWVDLALTGKSLRQNAAADPQLTPAMLAEFAAMYLGETESRTPLASPLYADLGGLPPLFIQAGTAEILLDDALRLAERAGDAGVDVTLDIWEEMVHGWQGFAGLVPEAFEALERAGAFVREQ